jgi:tetratricopeptide (TPR) repeat protein
MTEQKTMKISVKILIAVIIIAGILVYANAIGNGFVWDDEDQITNNLFIRSWGGFFSIWNSGTFFGGQAKATSGFYRPLVSLFYMASYSLFGNTAFGYHFLQIALHIINAILVFVLLRRIFEKFNLPKAREISFLSALIFVIHPANVESVAYAASVGETLYTFFILLCFLLFIRAARTDQKINNKLLAVSALFFFAGMLSKESAVVILPILIIYAATLVKPGREFYGKFALFFGIPLAIYALLRLNAGILPHSEFTAPISQSSFLERLLTLPYEIISYFIIIFFPKNLYISRHFVIHSPIDIKFWGSIIAIAAVGYIFYLIFRRPPSSRYIGTSDGQGKKNLLLLLFFLCWFFIALVPALNIIIPFEMTAAERWLYFPAIGLIALISCAAVKFISFLRFEWHKSLAMGLILFLLLVLAGRTMARNANWKNGMALYSHDIKYSKNSFDLENNYGVELFRAGNIAEAKQHFLKSVELENQWQFSLNNLGVIYEREGDYDQALAEYDKSMAVADYYLAYENAGQLLYKMNKKDEAQKILETAVLKFPAYSKFKLLLAAIYYEKKQESLALDLVNSVIKSEPENQLAKELLLRYKK